MIKPTQIPRHRGLTKGKVAVIVVLLAGVGLTAVNWRWRAYQRRLIESQQAREAPERDQWDRETAKKEHQAIADRFQVAISEYQSTSSFLDPARRLAEKYPLFDQAHALFGHVLHMEGQQDQAMAQLQIALRLTPDQPEMEALTGSIASALGEHDLAISHFRQAIKLASDNIKFYLLLAQANLDKGDVDQAKRVLLQETLPRDSSAHRAYYLLSRVYTDENKSQLAMDMIIKAIDRTPQVSKREDYLIYVREKSRLLRRQNEFEQAYLTLREHLTYKHERAAPEVVGEMATCLMMLGRPGEAAGLYEQAINEHLTHKDVLETLLAQAAQYRIRARDFDIAAKHIGALRAGNPRHPMLETLTTQLEEAKQPRTSEPDQT